MHVEWLSHQHSLREYEHDLSVEESAYQYRQDGELPNFIAQDPGSVSKEGLPPSALQQSVEE